MYLQRAVGTGSVFFSAMRNRLSLSLRIGFQLFSQFVWQFAELHNGASADWTVHTMNTPPQR